jgi:hypothetical protein
MWRAAPPPLPALNKGWTYYPPVARELRNCVAERAKAAKAAKAVKACSAEEKILGFCN